MENNSSDIWMNLAFQAGGGFIMGFAVGYAVKKVMKILIVVLGLFTLGLLYLANEGIISVNYDALVAKIEGATNTTVGAGAGLKSYVIANLPFAATFLAGFGLGFKIG